MQIQRNSMHNDNHFFPVTKFFFGILSSKRHLFEFSTFVSCTQLDLRTKLIHYSTDSKSWKVISTEDVSEVTIHSWTFFRSATVLIRTQSGEVLEQKTTAAWTLFRLLQQECGNAKFDYQLPRSFAIVSFLTSIELFAMLLVALVVLIIVFWSNVDYAMIQGILGSLAIGIMLPVLSAIVWWFGSKKC